ncbi:microtubule-associated protein 65-2 [Rhynchospora pubera]|uniref:Microtubule-associated protein 65-2 n=1 Tax=Rhynchospora pubera TaxID=906938 RepID=A0AAV8G8J3_9POAL|nr:microtubule-associated protein 65-2 [Rhynchospora pubera]
MVAQGESNDALLGQTTCGTLLHELQIIWDEVGESDEDRDRMLLQLEQECLDVYKRKVDQAAKSRAVLLQSLADARAQLVRLISALGDNSLPGIRIPDKSTGTIKEQLAAVTPTLDHLCKQKEERIKEFTQVQLQIQKIRGEITRERATGVPQVDEQDLSLEKLDEYQSQLKELQKEKSDRLRKVHNLVSMVHDLCAVLGMDFFGTVSEVDPSLNDSSSASIQSKSISNETLAKLSNILSTMKEDKLKRLQKLRELATQLMDLWNLMDTPNEERNSFSHVTCLISAGVDEVAGPGVLALDVLEQVEVEVQRLDQLMATKMKEIALKKQLLLEDIYARAHLKVDTSAAFESILVVIDEGSFDPSEMLQEMEKLVEKAREESMSRKEILDKVDRWMLSCEEESWLEDYSQDQNRYNASRGAHKNLKRAEKARILVNKIPALVDTLATKTRVWEAERGTPFNYDGVPLLAMLEEYMLLRNNREEERRRLKDQKKFQERANSSTTNGGTGSKRHSMNQNGSRSASRNGQRNAARPSAPVNYVAIAKDDTASHVSSNNPAGSGSP